MAAFLSCRVSHLTQVISGKNHLSPEMGYKCTEFFNLTPEEAHFFLLLLSKDRAGIFHLKKFYQDQIDIILVDRKKINIRIQTTDELSEIEKMTYYSSWHYKVIHILCSLPKINNVKDIAERLKLPMEKVLEVISFLEKTKIIKKENGELKTTGRRIHLDSKSKMNSRNHANLRMRSI